MSRKLMTTMGSDSLEGASVQVETMIPVRQRPRAFVAGAELESKAPSRPRVPRITRLLALAIKFQDMIERREVRDYADIARLGHVTRARVTQIMNLLMLAPDIQVALLSSNGPVAALYERDLRPVANLTFWRDQRELFGKILGR